MEWSFYEKRLDVLGSTSGERQIMKPPVSIGCGLDVLLEQQAGLLEGKRFGFVAHPASIDRRGGSAVVRLRARYGEGLAALFSPEHGFFGIAGAGDHVASMRHPVWNIPVHSLYGRTRRPSAAMLKGLDVMVYDLQDLSIRCYTYISTLRLVMEAAGARGVAVLVLDRSNPLAGMVDGPMLDPRRESFVGCFPGPLVYGLTSGEAAPVLKKAYALPVDLTVVRQNGHDFCGHRWIPPSPGIRTPHTAWCYPVTVGFEALPLVDYGRQTLIPFELIGLADAAGEELADRLTAEGLPGVAFHSMVYEGRGSLWRGVRLAVWDPALYQPGATAVAVLDVLQRLVGVRQLWQAPGSRPAFFDKLWGTASVRRALQAGVPWRTIVAGWQPELTRWRKSFCP